MYNGEREFISKRPPTPEAKMFETLEALKK
jgi:hypothetical protein